MAEQASFVSKSKVLRSLAVLVFLPCVIILTGCDTFRDSLNKQSDSYTQAKRDELQMAEGTYRGKMHLISSNQDFDCVLEVRLSSQVDPYAVPPDQTETVDVPKLEGGMHFPVLEQQTDPDVDADPQLTEPMGGNYTVIFDSGDFNPRTQELILPYTASGYTQGSLGELSGTLSNGQFTGTWFSKPFGDVGTFTFTQDQSTVQNGASTNGGSSNAQ